MDAVLSLDFGATGITGAANSLPRPVAAHLAAEANARINALQWTPPQLRSSPAAANDPNETGVEVPTDFINAADDILET